MTTKNSTKSKSVIDERRSGMLLHLSSLPSPYASGDLGKGAHDFLEVLEKSGQTWWQTLPVNPIGMGNSPYSSISAFAGEIIYIGQEGLFESGLLKKSELLSTFVSSGKTNYPLAAKQKMQLLRKAFTRKKSSAKYKYKNALRRFCFSERSWLGDYALFKVLSAEHGGDWSKWPAKLRNRDPETLGQMQLKFASEIEFIEFCQFEFFRQWGELKKEAKKRGILLMGDIPIFVAHESADVWANQKIFFLNKNGSPSFVAGCPPDKFCPDGQLWGNALYNWPAMQKNKFSWWVQRFEKLFAMYDSVRLDHFIGFYNYWKIPANAKTAKTGKWERARGAELFNTLKMRFGRAPLLAEDLGKVKQGVWDLRDKFDFPGMKILQFGFASGSSLVVHKTHHLPENSITYSGTHDNDTAVGWYQTVMKEKPSKHERESIAALFADPKKVGEDMIRLGMLSRSNIFIFPVQDVLNLGTKFRMNIPGTPKANWEFRLTPKQFKDLTGKADFLKGLSFTSERNR